MSGSEELAQGATAWIELSRGALDHNLRTFRRLVGPRVQIMAVVKANAYGHGMIPVARLALASEADLLGVDSVAEGLALRRAGLCAPVVVLGYTPPAAMEAALAASLELTLYGREALEAARSAARRLGTQARLHLKVETGTHRQGLPPGELLPFARLVHEDPHLLLAGLSTHFANIEDSTDHSYAEAQLTRYGELVKALDQAGIRPQTRHIACSAAALLMPRTHFDLIRLGISMYGLWPSKETYLSKLLDGGDEVVLRPVLAFKSRLAQVKGVPAGAYVSYGLTYRTTHPSRLAVLPVGYFEGLDRRLSNLGHVLVRGIRCPIRGRVCMNMCVVDVTDVPGAAVGDEAVILGAQGDERIGADDLAALMGTIHYEVLAGLAPSLPRFVVP